MGVMQTEHADSDSQPPRAAQSWFEDAAFRATLRELPPSAKLVAKVLDRHAAQTADQLAEHTLLPPRTVRYALTRLEDAELVTAQVALDDVRNHIYTLSQPDSQHSR